MQLNKKHKHIINLIFNNFNLCVKISNFIVIKKYEIGLSRKKTVQNIIMNNYKFLIIYYKNINWRIAEHDKNCNNITIVKFSNFPNSLQNSEKIRTSQFKNLIYKFENLITSQNIKKNDNDFQIFVNYGNNKLQFVNCYLYKNFYNLFPCTLINTEQFQNFCNPFNRTNQNVIGIYQNNMFNKFSYKSTIIIQLYNYNNNLEFNKIIKFTNHYNVQNIIYNKAKGIIILKGYHQIGYNQLNIINGYGIYIKKNNSFNNNYIENIYESIIPFATNHNLTYCAHILNSEVCKNFIPPFYIRKNINYITIDLEYYCDNRALNNSIKYLQKYNIKNKNNLDNTCISRIFVSMLYKLVKKDFTILNILKNINIEKFYNVWVYINIWIKNNIQKLNYHILFKNYTKLSEIYSNSIPPWITNIYNKIFNDISYEIIEFISDKINNIINNLNKIILQICNNEYNEVLLKLQFDEEITNKIKEIQINICNAYYEKYDAFINTKILNNKDSLINHIKLICAV